MIISHRHKFIFIKTRKTASTSVEIALSKFCGPTDIITRLTQKDEQKREKLGYRGAQNYKIPFSKYGLRDYLRALRQKKRLNFYSHVGVDYIKKYIDTNIWESYYKFCFERNPWDKMVSWYYWCYPRNPRPSFSDFVRSNLPKQIEGIDLYSLNSKIAVDKVFYYENLNSAMEEIKDYIGLNDVPILPPTKASYRDPEYKSSYRELYSAEDKRIIEQLFSREIEAYDYTF